MTYTYEISLNSQILEDLDANCLYLLLVLLKSYKASDIDQYPIFYPKIQITNSELAIASGWNIEKIQRVKKKLIQNGDVKCHFNNKIGAANEYEILISSVNIESLTPFLTLEEVFKLHSQESFIETVTSIYKSPLNSLKTLKAAYEFTESKFQTYFGQRRYSSFDSFSAILNRVVKTDANMGDQPECLTMSKASRITGLSTYRLQNLVKSGSLKLHQLGKSQYLLSDELYKAIRNS